MTNGAPALDNHAHRLQIGVVKKFWLDGDRKTRARLKFSRSEHAREIFQDIVDEIRSHVSIGYLVHDAVLEARSDKEGETWRITDWEPYEISMASVPADPNVGVGRTLETTGDDTVKRTNETPPDADDNNRGTDTQVDGNADEVRQAEQTRISELFAIGDQHNQRELAQQGVRENWTPDQMSRAVLQKMTPSTSGGAADNARDNERGGLPGLDDMGMTMRDLEGFRLMRAINAMHTGNWKKAGREREISIAIGTSIGKEARGLYVPHAYLAMRAGLLKNVANKGGELVATDLLDQEFVDITRAKSQVARLGARLLTGLVGDADIPKKTAGANFYWLDEDEDVTDTDFDLTTLPLTPKTIAGAIPVSRRMRKQSSISVERFISEDLITGLGVAIDHAAINGDGLANKPTGILNATGVNAATIPAGGIDWATVVDMESKIADLDADDGTLAYLTRATERGKAKVIEKAANTAQFIWDKGQVNGYQAAVSSNVPAARWIFGDFAQMIIAMWGVMDLEIDQAAKAASGGLVIRVFQDTDFQIRLPQAFTVAQPL